MFGGRIEGERKLKWPCGIAIYSNDMVYVSELCVRVHLGGSVCDVTWKTRGAASPRETSSG